MTISSILEGKDDHIVQCSGEVSVESAAAMLAEKRIGAMPVMDGDRVAGIFSERDVLYQLKDVGAEALAKQVKEIMTSDVVSVSSDSSAIGALSLMTKRRIRHLPVVDQDRLVGFVSIGDLVKYRIDRIEAEATAMRDYIQSV